MEQIDKELLESQPRTLSGDIKTNLKQKKIALSAMENEIIGDLLVKALTQV